MKKETKLPSEYLMFIDECKNKVYEENTMIHKHHILPKFMGGTDDDSNLVELSVKDHFEAHKILAENVSSRYTDGAWVSLNLLKKYWDGEINEISEYLSERMKGSNNIVHLVKDDPEWRRRNSERNSGKLNPFYGKRHSKKTKEILSKKHTKWLLENGSPFKGKKHKPETIQKLREKAITQMKEKHPSSKLCIDLETGIFYDQIKDLAHAVNIPKSTLADKIRSNKTKRFKAL